MTLPARPSVEIIEEGMREGMQIESAGISVAAKVELLDALSATGLRHIVVGSFVSPRWVPQMAAIEEILAKFTPNPDVTYTALALNARGAQRRAAFVPPLAPPDGIGRSMVHLCDVFVQRNTARTVADELSALPRAVADGATGGATEATVAVNAAWGSNWLGEFTQQQRTECIERQMDAWSAAGIATTGVYLGDPMSWNTPRAVRSQLREIVRRWPEVRTIHLHLHDGRGAALPSAYAALGELDQRHKLIIDSAIGFARKVADHSENETEARRATSLLYHVASAVALAWEAHRIHEMRGDARRLLLSRLVIDHRLSTGDPFRLADDGKQRAITDALLGERALGMAEAGELAA